MKFVIHLSMFITKYVITNFRLYRIFFMYQSFILLVYRSVRTPVMTNTYSMSRGVRFNRSLLQRNENILLHKYFSTCFELSIRYFSSLLMCYHAQFYTGKIWLQPQSIYNVERLINITFICQLVKICFLKKSQNIKILRISFYILKVKCIRFCTYPSVYFHINVTALLLKLNTLVTKYTDILVFFFFAQFIYPHVAEYNVLMRLFTAGADEKVGRLRSLNNAPVAGIHVYRGVKAKRF